jgi:hypothetical protein
LRETEARGKSRTRRSLLVRSERLVLPEPHASFCVKAEAAGIALAMKGADSADERASEWEPARADDVLHDQRRRQSLHAWKCRQLLVVDAAVGVEIRRDDAQQVIRVAESLDVRATSPDTLRSMTVTGALMWS